MGKVVKYTRRAFLIGASAVAGGVAFGYYKFKTPYPNPLEADLNDGEAALTPYVLIKSDGVTIITPRGEMGQGVQTTLAALVAEELDISWDSIKIAHGPAAKAYYNAAVMEEGLPISSLDESGSAKFMRKKIVPVVAKAMAMQITGGSSASADAYVKMRVAGATAREGLKSAAAKRIGVKAQELKTQDGHVIAPNGTKIAYTDLAMDAAKVKLPKSVTLRPASEWKYVGKSMPLIGTCLAKLVSP